MLAATPEAGAAHAPEAASDVAEMKIAAAGQFTHRLRAYFLVIGLLAWFLGPWEFVGATVVIVTALANRQFNSTRRMVAVRSERRLKGARPG